MKHYLLALLCVAALVGPTACTSEEWKPYAIDDSRRYEADSEAVLKRRGIPASDYKTLTAMLRHDSRLHLIITRAMKDGRVSQYEWNAIMNENELSWQRYAKKKKVEAAQELESQLGQ